VLSSSTVEVEASPGHGPQSFPVTSILQVTTNILRALAAIKGTPLEQLKLSVEVLSDILGIPFVRQADGIRALRSWPNISIPLLLSHADCMRQNC